LKIIFAIKALNDVNGGAERVIVTVASGLADLGHEVSILTFDHSDGTPFYPLSQKVSRICLDIGNVQQNTNVSETLARIKSIRTTLKREQPDVAVPFMHSMIVPMALASFGLGITLIGSEHITPDHYKTRKFEFFLFVLASCFVKRITVLSEHIKKTYPWVLRRKMVPIPNPVLSPSKEFKRTNNRSRKIILNIGRLVQQKDQATLIKAFALLSVDFLDWDLRIVGEGTLRTKLEELVVKLSIESRVLLPGSIEKIEAEYFNADIFVISSGYESFGLVTAEAMACGLPCIGFADCPGTNELINHGVTGLLAKGLSNPSSLADTMREAITNYQAMIEMAVLARQDIQKFGADSVVEIWDDQLNKILS
jgi:glycosyltransferase involved in cell wall biosynthesis